MVWLMNYVPCRENLLQDRQIWFLQRLVDCLWVRVASWLSQILSLLSLVWPIKTKVLIKMSTNTRKWSVVYKETEQTAQEIERRVRLRLKERLALPWFEAKAGLWKLILVVVVVACCSSIQHAHLNHETTHDYCSVTFTTISNNHSLKSHNVSETPQNLNSIEMIISLTCVQSFKLWQTANDVTS